MHRQLLVAAMIALPALPARAELPPLIPRDVLFGNPDKAGVQISPDGKHLAYLAPDDKNVLQVWVRPIDKAEAKKITSDEKRGIRQYFWPHDGKHILYLQDVGGDENFHLFATELATGKTRDLTPFPGVRARARKSTRNTPTRSWSHSTSATRRCSICTASLSRPARRSSTPRTPGRSSSWTTDKDFVVRAATTMNPKTGGYDVMVREKPGADWKVIKSLVERGAGGGRRLRARCQHALHHRKRQGQHQTAHQTRPGNRQGRGAGRGQGVRRWGCDHRRQRSAFRWRCRSRKRGPSGRRSTNR